MKPLLRTPALAGALLVAFAAGCTDRPLPTLTDGPEVDDPEAPESTPVHLVAITCTADVRAAEVTCEPAVPQTPGVAADLIVGGNNTFVQLIKNNGAYDASTQEFAYDVRLRNLIPQPLGTTDGITVDPKGVKVFFQSGPTVTAGSGIVTVNSDGMDMFTSGAQHYFQWSTRIDPFTQTGVRRWSFTMPSTVLGFRYTVFVAAPVPYPEGWVDLEPSTFTIRPTAQWTPKATVRSAVGTVLADEPLFWSTSDTTLATVTADGVVTGVRGGTALISATSGPRSGSATFLVTGITRVWTGAVSSDWHNGQNWSLNGVVPTTTDTAHIPAGLATPYPLLVQNALVGDVVVENAATVEISAFDLTTVGNLSTGLSGGISGGSGRVVLSGTAKLVRGVLPRTTVLGTYTLDGNLTLRAPLRVQLGRIRSSSFRIRATSF